ncbi:calcineurin-binding protein cabin-1-like, partial [Sceloporus undulatus]|uniref:calcineurin-binding protein cabin-1-like n=1 Tax=Sceloporus undulatus TaxID=8520 RepID=UPI001C4A9032
MSFHGIFPHVCLFCAACLYFICKALERDRCYAKGLVLKEKIFEEQPCLRRDSLRMFLKGDFSVHDVAVDQSEAAAILEEALELRRRRRALLVRKTEPDLKLFQPIAIFTWKCVGETLLATYRHMTTCELPRPSLGKRVDLLEYQDLDRISDGVTASVDAVSIIQTNTVHGGGGDPVTPVSEPVLTFTPVTPTFPNARLLDAIGAAGDTSDKSKKAAKRKRIAEESGETAKRRSARVRNTKSKKEEKVDFQELLVKFLPSRLRKLDTEDDTDGIFGNYEVHSEAKEESFNPVG